MPPEEPQGNPVQDKPEKAKPAETSEAGRQLSFVGQFIDKYYLQQSKGVQTGTFIVFVLLFAYGFMNVLNGKYVLKGNLLAESPRKCGQSGCITLAGYYGVRWGTDDFASNSKGEYYVALGFADYLRAVVSGSHEITFLQSDPQENKEQVVWSGSVLINRMEGEFANVTIPYTAPLAPAPTLPGASNRDAGSVLFPVAWAEVSANPGMYRLLVQGIRLAPESAKANATIELIAFNQTLEMKDRSMADLAAGHIPVNANQSIDLGSSLYFSVPGNSLPVRGAVRLTAPTTGFFQIASNYEEDFPLPPDQAAGQALQLTGSRGSTLTVRIVLAQPVKLYRESNWAAKKDAIEADFLSQGFLVLWTDPPQGPLAETNALWTGPMVSFDVVQRLLKVAINEGIPLKKIEYRYHFQSSPNPAEMQVGSSATCAKAAPIPAQALSNAVAAHSDEEFQKVISPFSCQTSPAAHAQARRGNH